MAIIQNLRRQYLDTTATAQRVMRVDATGLPATPTAQLIRNTDQHWLDTVAQAQRVIIV